jgi:protein-disulfide isomerase-like protein with CxxC motif
MIVSLHVTHFSDPGCPWAWSASPALSALKWRYGDQLEWRNVMIGLTENGAVYEKRGYTPAGQARGYRNFRERGMPFATEPREKVHGTWPMCRVVVATRLLVPEREYAVFRALQFAQFTTTAFLEDADQLRKAIEWVPGIDADRIIEAAGDPATEEAFERDRDEARSAANSPTEFQDKHANTDGRVRYTAPSVKFRNQQGVTLEAGGFQSFEAYDVLIANLDPALERRPPPSEPLEVLAAFPYGLTTYEVAAVMTPNNGRPDPAAAEAALIDEVASGEVIREPLGDGALWLAAPYAPRRRSDRGRTAAGRARAPLR